jgi:hypothetical protein
MRKTIQDKTRFGFLIVHVQLFISSTSPSVKYHRKRRSGKNSPSIFVKMGSVIHPPKSPPPAVIGLRTTTPRNFPPACKLHRNRDKSTAREYYFHCAGSVDLVTATVIHEKLICGLRAGDNKFVLHLVEVVSEDFPRAEGNVGWGFFAF